MNKKGFTLIEILAVIVIIGVLIAIAVPSTLAISRRMKANMYCTKIEILLSDAKRWGTDHTDELNRGKRIRSIGQLINEGYIKAEEDGKVLDPRDNESMNDYEIGIYIKNKKVYVDIVNRDMSACDKEYIYFEEDIVDEEEEEEDEEVEPLLSAPLFIATPIACTNKDVSLIINYPSEKYSKWQYEYSNDNVNWTIVEGITANVTVTNNSNIIARIVNKNSPTNVLISSSYTIDNINKTPPAFTYSSFRGETITYEWKNGAYAAPSVSRTDLSWYCRTSNIYDCYIRPFTNPNITNSNIKCGFNEVKAYINNEYAGGGTATSGVTFGAELNKSMVYKYAGTKQTIRLEACDAAGNCTQIYNKNRLIWIALDSTWSRTLTSTGMVTKISVVPSKKSEEPVEFWTEKKLTTSCPLKLTYTQPADGAIAQIAFTTTVYSTANLDLVPPAFTSFYSLQKAYKSVIFRDCDNYHIHSAALNPESK